MKVDGIIKIYALAALFLLLPDSPLRAETLRLSVGGAVEMALENNLTLKKNLIDLSSAAYQAKHLWAEFFPTINASASAGYGSSLFSGNGFVLNDTRQGMGGTYSAGVGIRLGLSAATSYTIKNIRLAYQGRLLEYEDARNLLEIQVTKDFYSLIADRENLNLLDEILKLASRQFERNEIAFSGGLVSELTVTQSRLAMENARYNLSVARSAFENRLGEFLALLGIAHNAETALEGKIELARFDPDAESLIRRYLQGRPDIESSRREIERLENEAKETTLSARAPSLTLSTDWSSGNFDPFSDKLSGSIGINIPVDPWIAGAKDAQAIRGAKLAIEKAKLDLEIAEDAARTAIRSLAAELRNSWESVEIARLGLQAARRTYELTEEGFNSGAIESLKLEDARNNLADARQQLLRSELNCQLLILDLSAAVNVNWKELAK